MNKLNLVARIIAITFIFITAVILALAVFGVVEMEEVRDGLVKLAIVAAVALAASFAVSLLNRK